MSVRLGAMSIGVKNDLCGRPPLHFLGGTPYSYTPRERPMSGSSTVEATTRRQKKELTEKCHYGIV